MSIFTRWGQAARDAKAAEALSERLGAIKEKATRFEREALDSAMEAGVTHRVGDEILLDGERLPGCVRSVDGGKQVVNLHRRLSSFDPRPVVTNGVDVTIHDDAESEVIRREWLSVTPETARRQLLDRTDQAIDNGSDSTIDWLEVPE